MVGPALTTLVIRIVYAATYLLNGALHDRRRRPLQARSARLCRQSFRRRPICLCFAPITVTAAAKNAPIRSASEDDPNDENPDVSHHLKSSHCSFRFANDPTHYPTHECTRFPVRKSPSPLQDTHRTHLARSVSHRCVYLNPNAGGLSFCALALLWSYISPFSWCFLTSCPSTPPMPRDQWQKDETRLPSRAIGSGPVTMLRNMRNKLVERQELEAIPRSQQLV